MPPRLLLASACLLPAACAGPMLHLHGPGGDRVFVDGRELARDAAGELGPLPFRYYGTGRWHAAPGDHDGDPDWSRLPADGTIDQPAPISAWLFPFDFPLEVLRRVVVGREDHHAQIALPAIPPERLPPADVPPPGLAELVARADAARVRR